MKKIFLRATENIQQLRGRSLPLGAHPLKISSYFLIFIIESIEVYRETSREKEIPIEAIELLINVSNYIGYSANNKEFRDKLSDSVKQFAKKMETISPLTSGIKKDFNNWNAIFERVQGLSYIDEEGPRNLIHFSLSEFDKLRLKQKEGPLIITSADCISLIHRVLLSIEVALPLVETCVKTLLKECSEEGIATNWKFSGEDKIAQTQFKRAFRDPNHSQRLNSEECGKLKNPLHNFSFDIHRMIDPFSLKKTLLQLNVCVPKNQLLNNLQRFIKKIRDAILSIKTDEKNIRKDMGLIWGACKHLLRDKNVSDNKKDLTFERYSDIKAAQLQSKLDSLTKSLKNLNEKNNENKKAYEDFVHFLEERIKLHKKSSEAGICIEVLLFSLINDLSRLVDGYIGRSPQTKAEGAIVPLSTVQVRQNAEQKADLAMQQLIRDTSKTQTQRRKGKKKRSKQKKIISAVKSEKVSNVITQQALEPSKKEKLDFTASVITLEAGQSSAVLCRNLWYQYVQSIPHLLDNFSSKLSSLNLYRFSVMAVHGLLEQTLLNEANQNKPSQQKTHNLWFYRNVIPKRLHCILETFYDAHNCARFGRELNFKSDQRLTLPYRSQVLEWLFKNSRQPMSKEVIDQIVRWMKQGETLFNHVSEIKMRKIQDKKVTPLKSIALPRLDSILQKLKNADKTPWLEQWIDDLSDLDEMLNIMAKGNFPATLLPVFTEHVLMLTTGIVQSPLYALEIKRTGSHSLHHDLELLWKENHLPMPEDSSQFGNLLKGISTIHRYPFEGKLRSVAHRLYLNAIAIGFNPELDDGFEVASSDLKEGELDNLGRPFLKKYLNIDELRIQIIKWVKEVVAMTQNQLVKKLLQS